MKNQLERSLRNAVDCMPHPSFEKIAAVQVRKMDQMDDITCQETDKTFWGWYSRKARLSAACLFFCCCLIFGGGWYTQNLLVYNIIDLDVNPSFELKTNKKEQILSLKGCNEEAAALLEGTNYKNMAVDDAVESLIVLLREKNYISEHQKTVLLTVGSRRDTRGTELKTRLSGKIKDTLKTSGVSPVIIRQTMNSEKGTAGKEIKKEAKEWSVSEGKLQLIRRLLQNDPNQSMEELASMPVEQLLDILDSQGEPLPGEIEVDFDEEEDFGEEDSDNNDREDNDQEDADREDDDQENDQDHEDKNREEDKSSAADDFDDQNKDDKKGPGRSDDHDDKKPEKDDDSDFDDEDHDEDSDDEDHDEDLYDDDHDGDSDDNNHDGNSENDDGDDNEDDSEDDHDSDDEDD